MKILWLLPLLFMFGCADSGTYGNSTERNYEDLLRISNNSGTINNNIYLTGSSETRSDLQQDTANEATVSPKTSAGWNGGTAALADEGAEFMMEGISSLFQEWQDKRKSDSDNTESSSTTNNSFTDSAESMPDNDDGVVYKSRFHHTQTNGSDGGQSLVLCLGQDQMFDSCFAGDVNIPYHGKDKDRLAFWNMNEYGEGDIVCEKDGEEYRYPANETLVYGDC